MNIVDFFSFFFHTSLFILTWVIQLVIYPSFMDTEGEMHRSSHTRYIKRSGSIAIPLMFGQLVLSIFAWFEHSTPIDTVIVVLVAVIWVVTLFFALPAHQKVNDSETETKAEDLRALYRWHSVRSTAWTAIWLLDVAQYLKNNVSLPS